MRRRQFFSYVCGHTGLVVTASLISGCGTVMHPERRHHSHSGQIDWKIAALNGLGLVLFFVPGVIAFAVDFYTGAIYLPAGYANSGSSPSLAWQRLGLKRIDVPRDQLTPRQIEQIVREQAGQEVSLADANARLSQLTRIDQFDEHLRQHRCDSSFGMAVRSFFS